MYTPPATHCEAQWKASMEFLTQTCPSKGPTLMKLTTICDHVISFTSPSSPLFFEEGKGGGGGGGGHREEGLGMRLAVWYTMGWRAIVDDLPTPDYYIKVYPIPHIK